MPQLRRTAVRATYVTRHQPPSGDAVIQLSRRQNAALRDKIRAVNDLYCTHHDNKCAVPGSQLVCMRLAPLLLPPPALSNTLALVAHHLLLGGLHRNLCQACIAQRRIYKLVSGLLLLAQQQGAYSALQHHVQAQTRALGDLLKQRVGPEARRGSRKVRGARVAVSVLSPQACSELPA